MKRGCTLSDQNNEGKKHGPRRKRVYIAVISSAATVGVALTLIFASSFPWGAELLTQGRESSVDKGASSANSESDSTAISGEETDSENSGSRGNESTTEDQTPVLPSEESKQEECETPVAGSEYVVIVEIRHCEFAYFELDDYDEPKEITREEATRQRADGNSDTGDWEPTPPSDNASGSSDSDSQDTITDPEPSESDESVSAAEDDYDSYEPPIICPQERSENPEVYDACREGFVPPTQIRSLGILKCVKTYETDPAPFGEVIPGRVPVYLITQGIELVGGNFGDWSSRWTDSGPRTATITVKTYGLGEGPFDDYPYMLKHSIGRTTFLSMDDRYLGEIYSAVYDIAETFPREKNMPGVYGDLRACN
jgi:hypothetical protein